MFVHTAGCSCYKCWIKRKKIGPLSGRSPLSDLTAESIKDMQDRIANQKAYVEKMAQQNQYYKVAYIPQYSTALCRCGETFSSSIHQYGHVFKPPLPSPPVTLTLPAVVVTTEQAEKEKAQRFHHERTNLAHGLTALLLKQIAYEIHYLWHELNEEMRISYQQNGYRWQKISREMDKIESIMFQLGIPMPDPIDGFILGIVNA